ncbi:MAG: DUF7345 domain-containing protein [Halolamina sp.]
MVRRTGSGGLGRGVLAVAVAMLLCSAGVGAAAELPALQTGDVETDSVILEADVDEDGDARWTVEYRVALDDENTTDSFEELQADIEANESDYRSQFASRMRTTVGSAENATGREMAVENVTVEATTSPISGEYGVVRYGFDWVGFAERSDGRLGIGDAVAGLFLDADTDLTVSWPEGYVADVVDPEPDREGDRSVTWTGPKEFASGQPQVVLRPRNSIPSWGPLVGVLLFAGGGALWYYRRRVAERSRGSSDEVPPARAGASDGEQPQTAEGTAAPEGGSAAGIPTDEAAAGATAAETPEELLSPEERVLGLLEANGGRMKQKAVTEELGWSAARTSQVVSSLREDGAVESFRLGRENVLKFPDDE